MTVPVAGLALLVLLVALPAVVGIGRGVSPRVAAGVHLVSLLGWGLLPAAALACGGAAVGSWLAGIRAAGGGCLLGLERGQWLLLGYVPAAAAFGILVRQAVRSGIAARRVELRGLALAGATSCSTSGGIEVWVVPSERPAAFAGGWWHPRAAVTSGLLAPLGEDERRAVLEHEAAHVRFGHPRLLVPAGAVAAAYGRFPPVRRAWDGLRRELEAAADDEAARVVGAATVITALVRVALAVTATPGGAAAFGGGEHLRYRIARLEQPRPVQPGPTAMVGATTAGVAAAMAWAACLLAGGHATAVGIAFCAAVAAATGLWPAWAWRRPLLRR